MAQGIAQSLKTCQEVSATGERRRGGHGGHTIFFMSFFSGGELEFMDHWEVQTESAEDAGGAGVGDGG